MDPIITAVLLGAYASLAFELTIIHVPSVASTANVWCPRQDHIEVFSARTLSLLSLSWFRKLIAFVLPLAVIYALFAYPLLVIVVGPDPFGDYLFSPPVIIQIAAVLVVLGGRALSIWSALTIRHLNSQKAGQFHLHISGPFRLSRNPGLIGMYLFVLGMWLVMPSVAMLTAIIVYVVHMHIRVQMEEDFLRGKFGDCFLRYSRQTPRYLL